MKKFWISFLIILTIVLLPIGGFFIYGECVLPHDVYSETYYAELKDKVNRLETRNNNKIVFIGGSSLIFGLRSEEIEKATGYDVVDFGLYASLGTSLMMDLAIDYIKEGDVVVLAPEINPQTYSSYIGYDVALKCFENMGFPWGKYNLNNTMDFFFHYFKYVIDKGTANIKLEAPYDKASFNEYTDIDNEIVKNNILSNYYDPTQMIEPTSSLISNDFVNMVNSYYQKVTSRKAKLFFSFSPSNALALNKEYLDDFNRDLEGKLKCPILGSVEDFTYHQYYFYDTNYHLNRSGSYLHSRTLVDLLKEELGIINEYQIDVPDAPKPQHEKSDVIDVVDGVRYQEVRDIDGALVYYLLGFEDSMKNITEFRVKDEVNGIKIVSINLHAFKDMPNLEKVIISKNVDDLSSPLFKNCPNVLALYLEHEVAPNVCATGLVDGASPNIKIYLKRQYYTKFINDYSWMEYRSLFEPY